MMKLMLLTAIPVLVMLNSCCSSCNRFWEQVDAGYFHDELLQAKVVSALERGAPARFQLISKTVLTRAKSEQIFTLRVTVDRRLNTISAKGLDEKGEPIFSVAFADGKATVISNYPPLDENFISQGLVPTLTAIFLPRPSENAIVQDGANGMVLHRSRRKDGSQETYAFSPKDMKWQVYSLKSFRVFGTVVRLKRVMFSDFRTIPVSPEPFPHRIEISDEAQGFKACLEVRSLTAI